jgi:hypothetical protein
MILLDHKKGIKKKNKTEVKIKDTQSVTINGKVMLNIFTQSGEK